MWFTETPWPPIMIFSAIAAGLAAALVTTQQGRYVIGIVAMLIASLVTYLVEQNIVTESERVEQAIYDVAAAFQARDVDRTLSFFSTHSVIPSEFDARDRIQFSLQRVAEVALQAVEVRGDLRITDMSIDMKNGRATSRFRANGSFIFRGHDVGHQATRWDVDWQQEGNDWRIVKVQRLDPISGAAMGVFEDPSAPRPN